MPLIAIAGGIGCGKSVISRILTAMGYKVYDCDIRAKQLMDNSETIKSAIESEIHPAAITSSREIDRKFLASIVFNDRDKLLTLNSIVHAAVKKDLAEWRCRNSATPLWVESAIIYESGISEIVDEVWEVIAPIDLRIERVVKRNAISPEEVKQRIDSQAVPISNPHKRVFTILNDGVQPVLPQILNLLKTLS